MHPVALLVCPSHNSPSLANWFCWRSSETPNVLYWGSNKCWQFLYRARPWLFLPWCSSAELALRSRLESERGCCKNPSPHVLGTQSAVCFQLNSRFASHEQEHDTIPTSWQILCYWQALVVKFGRSCEVLYHHCAALIKPQMQLVWQ